MSLPARAVATLPVRVLVTILMTALLASLLVGAVRSPASASPSTDYAGEARVATNGERTARGRRSLAADACLTRHAQRQAERMADRGRLAHTANLAAVARACGLRAWGENVAQALPSDDGRGVVQLWMDSPGHRRNLLDGTYRRVGLAAVRRGGNWWVVQILGRRR